MNTTVLLSGGLDSASLIEFYRRLGHDVTALFIDYGQPVREQERRSARALASHYNIPLAIVGCTGPQVDYSGEIRGRNALLLFAALMFSPLKSGIIGLGIHSATPYYNCSELFANDLKRIMDGYSDGQIRLGLPFLTWTKPMILEFAQRAGVPLHLTWSCEIGCAVPPENRPVPQKVYRRPVMRHRRSPENPTVGRRILAAWRLKSLFFQPQSDFIEGNYREDDEPQPFRQRWQEISQESHRRSQVLH